MGERKHRLPHALALEDAHADHLGGEGLVDQPRDLEPVLAVVAVVDLADESRVGPHARDDGAALEDGVRAAAEVPGEGNLDGDGLDALDAHVGLPGRSRRPCSTGAQARRASGPRRSRPGSAPVCLPSRSTVSPLTTVAEMPRARCTRRRAPAGRSFTTSGISGATVSGSKTTRSAANPSRTRPRSEKPQWVALSKLSMRTACSRVSACFLRTQWLRRWVCSEASMIWETWAPESEKATTVRGCLISSRAWSWFSLAMGWRKKRSRSFSRARSIMASTGPTPRSRAISATERYGPWGASMRKIHS